MGDTIRFETNIPVEMAFNYSTGKEYEGRYGPQFLRGTTDGRFVYLPPIVEQRLCEAEVAPGERVAICKREMKDGRKKGIVWEVKRVDAPGEPGDTGGNPAKNTPPVRTAQPKQMNGHSQAITAPAISRTENGQKTDNPVIHTQTSALMSGALVASIDALTTAKQYGRAKGLELNFNEEDVRAIASTIYITASKQVSTWQH